MLGGSSDKRLETQKLLTYVTSMAGAYSPMFRVERSWSAPYGAVVIRSDEVRKQLCGVPSLARLGPEGYTADISSRVYATMGARAELIVRSGRSVL